MKISFVVTVLNEEKTIDDFLISILDQSILPDEVIIVDGGSSDRTVAKIKNQISRLPKPSPKFKLFVKKGNRSVGRNEAIKKSTGDVIAISDAGCILDRNWLSEIVRPFENQKTDVVAGYYRGKSKNIFEKCLVPYVLVMPDKLDPSNFLPATRSMAFRKFVWKKIGGFSESLSHNEDYDFAKKIEKNKFNIKFAKNAIVNWIPRSTFKQSFVMFLRFAQGDSQAKTFREKVIYIFLRYLFGMYLLILGLIMHSLALLLLIAALFIIYLIWSVQKNYKYVKNHKAIIYLPLLQINSDIAVILGTILGIIKKSTFRYLLKIIKDNKSMFLIILIYLEILFIFISWGIPGSNHPFNYHMDEWHQLQSVRNLFIYGSPNIPGSANGSIFHFFLTGLYLIPFYILRIINPFEISSAVENPDTWFHIFEILRLNTFLFGALSAILFGFIIKKFFDSNSLIGLILFIFNPVFLILSIFFKYDIALIFWILTSFLLLLKYVESGESKYFIFGSLLGGIAFSVKLSAAPLLPILITTFFVFSHKPFKKIKILLIGILTFALTFLFLGIPDVLFSIGNLNEYLISNLIKTPNALINTINYGNNILIFLIFHVFPTALGHVFFILLLLSILFVLLYLIKGKSLGSYLQLTVIFFVYFMISILFLRETALNNRLLVIVPFAVLIIIKFLVFFNKNIKSRFLKTLYWIFIFIILLVQIFETFSWLLVKLDEDPRQASSVWINENIPLRSTIGIENIPIYQFLPDLLLKDFYQMTYKVKAPQKFKYQVVNSKSKLPEFLVITNGEIEDRYYKISDKKELLKKMRKENYKKMATFVPNLKYVRLFNTEFEIYISGLLQSPNAISIYKKY